MIETIENAIAKFPDLTDFGFGVYADRKLSPAERQRTYAADRAMLFHPRSLDGFAKACAWLAAQPRTVNVNRAAGSSYGLKHVAEHEIGYVTNGIFIAAAIASGFKVCPIPGSPNAWFNISKRARRIPADVKATCHE